MAVCFFDNELSKKYRCTYFEERDYISVSVEYNITEEIPSQNGVRLIGNYDYKQRDIFIADSENNIYLLLKDAFYAGNSNKYAKFEDLSITVFRGRVYFSNRESDSILKLPTTPKCSAIRIFSKDLLDKIGVPSYKKETNDEELVISLKKKNPPIDCGISTQKIRSIIIADSWSFNEKWERGKFTIDTTPYFEIRFKRRQNYDEIYKYIHELEIYMELYIKGGFKIDDLSIQVDDKFYKFGCWMQRFEYKGRKKTAVSDDMEQFLKKCYESINYSSTNKVWIRNIPYAIGLTSINIEDSFLSYYKFIECFYKNKHKQNTNCFITDAIEEYYSEKEYLKEELRKLSREVVCLRNHYIHAGYFIKNNRLKISKKKGDDSFEEYMAEIDIEWLFERTSILRKITIEIIYKELLGYNGYSY